MTQWPSTKAKRVLAGLERIGWVEKRSLKKHKVTGSEREAKRPVTGQMAVLSFA
jgi:hypothetical protein